MERKLTLRMLAHISAQLNDDQALWAVLTANEYLEPTSSLRKAFVTRARQQIAASSLTRNVNNRIFEGARLSDFSPHVQLRIRSITKPKILFRPLESSLCAAARRPPYRVRKENLARRVA